MAILLEFKYDKRLGLPGYSSHDFGVSMRTEVNNVDQIKEESERAYRLLQQSVDSQLSNPGFIPSENGKEHKQETKKNKPRSLESNRKAAGTDTQNP